LRSRARRSSVASLRNDPASFGTAVDALDAGLTVRGFTVDQIRRYESFAQLRVMAADGLAVDMDLAVDWRSAEPVSLPVGPMLAVEDAVGTRSMRSTPAPRHANSFDVDAIHRSGRFTDEQLLEDTRRRVGPPHLRDTAPPGHTDPRRPIPGLRHEG
jgi:hypothetical protein